MDSLDGSARRRRWTPPARPDWVSRLNEEGAALDLHSVVPLDEASLLDAAIANTGSDDFGEPGWYEPFKVLVRALNEESELTLVGRLMARSDLLITLEARLRIEATYKQHPEIDDEEIIAPLLIVGQGRSGTSVLQNLLSADPENETVRNWEVLFPCPPPEASTYRTDPRIERADRITTQWNRVVPTLVSMHEFDGRAPVESVQLHCLGFRSPAWFNMFGQVPSYSAHMMAQDPADAYRYEKRVLKLLQWRNPRRTWIMKSPFALTHLPSVFDVYPDVGIVWPHRDPVKALSSVVSLLGTLHWMRSDNPFIGDSLAVFTNPDLAAGMMTQPIQWLEDGTIPRARVCNIRYGDFVRDPMSVVENIYRTFDLPLSDGARGSMFRFMEDNPRSGRPAHDYDIGTEDEIVLERAAFEEYQKYFDVPDEI